MSRILSVSCMLLFFFLLLFFPSAAADGASAGILLWYRKILPVLFPSHLLRADGASNIISFLPPAVGMAVLGWCCGYRWEPYGQQFWSERKAYLPPGRASASALQSAQPDVSGGISPYTGRGSGAASTPCGSISSTALDSSPTALHLWKRKQRKNRENSWRSSYPPNP